MRRYYPRLDIGRAHQSTGEIMGPSAEKQLETLLNIYGTTKDRAVKADAKRLLICFIDALLDFAEIRGNQRGWTDCYKKESGS
jgi:hypothetical protein